MTTFRLAAISAALASTAPAPASERASTEPCRATNTQDSMTCRQQAMISSGTSQAPTSAFCSAAFWAARSASVSLGIP